MLLGIDMPISLAGFENQCASNFVKETQFQLLHYCRALAMKAWTLSKIQKFDCAFAVLEKMKSLYDPEIHTAAIAKAYGVDHAANMFAISALWHQHLNQTEKALATCEDVIQHVLPEVAKTNTNNSDMLGLNYFMLPIIQFLTSQGQNGANRSYDLYNSYVVEPFNSGSKRALVGILSIR